MKLFELIGVSKKDVDSSLSNMTDTEHDEFFDLLDHLFKHQVKGERLGKGAFSVVVDNKVDPGTVTKISYGYDKDGYTLEKLYNDAYLKYIMSIVEDGRMDSNPYLPKVYKIDFYKTKTGLIAFTLEIERLHPVDDLSVDELLFLGDKIFGNFSEYIHSMFGSAPEYDEDDEYNKELFKKYKVRITDHFADVIEALASRGTTSTRRKDLKIIDPRFRHAISIINQLKRGGGVWMDIHAGNLMFRRTQHGPQLVITDPIS